MSNSQKSFMSVRSKLIAAVAMLLVASFMVVSSTYAWFTLSTAPEVTGITTQIGANGNLEIALNTGAAINNYLGNALGATVDRNNTWGNLIDLTDESYGLTSISLKPSLLAVGSDGNINLDSPLYTPSYSSDGRLETVKNNGFFGSKDENGFVRQPTAATSGYGVRALGTVSSMTAQQLKYTSTATVLKANLTTASSAAYLSMTKPYGTNNQIGGALVSLILKGALDSESNFTAEELAPLAAMIGELDDAPAALKEAIKNFMILALANQYKDLSDEAFNAAVNAFENKWDSIYDQLGTLNEDGTITISLNGELFGDISVTLDADKSAKLNTVVTTCNNIAEAIATANSAYEAALAPAVTKIQWSHVTAILTPLMDIEDVLVNGKDFAWISRAKAASAKAEADRTTDQEKQDAKDFGQWIVTCAGGVRIEMPAGSGVYADIASLTSNITINIKPKVTVVYGSLVLEDAEIPVTMATTVSSDSIIALDASYIGYPASRNNSESTKEAITDIYAYVLDFAFRTNAADSNLLLQRAATDRIYGDSENTNPNTMGGGSYMEIATSASFAETAVKTLMGNIRIVFADTDSGEVLACARLDTSTPASGSNVKASIVLCDYEIKTPYENYSYIQFGAARPATSDGTTANPDRDVITSLSQNAIKNISVYVYLDGNEIENADVPALADIQVKMNLQFASSAELKPMDYTFPNTENNQ